MLRQRGGNNSPTYSRVLNTDEEFNMIEPPVLQQSFRRVPSSSFTCVYFCFVFSLIAIAFLSSIASMLNHDSLYITIKTGDGSKRDLAKNVEYAAILYGLCAAFSLLIIILHRWSTSVAGAGGSGGSKEYIVYDDGFEVDKD